METNRSNASSRLSPGGDPASRRPRANILETWKGETSAIKTYEHRSFGIIRPAPVQRKEEMIELISSPSTAVSAVCIFVSLLCLMASGAAGEYGAGETSSSGASSGSSNDRLTSSGAGNEFRSCAEGKCMKRTTPEVTGGMWFGPRLGRRRRSNGAEKLARELDSEIEAIANVLDGARWALITVPGDKRQSTRFTPRLGRESGEDYPSYMSNGISNDRDDFREELREDYREEPLREEERGSSLGLFAPRLGRRLPWAPSPRLGRRLRSILQKI